jgi:hypothetical protein
VRQNEELICAYWSSSLPGFVNHPWRGLVTDGLQILAVTLADAQFATMERESSSHGQFWELDETVWQLAKRLLTLLFGKNDETKPHEYHYPCWKTGKQLKSNSALFCPQDTRALAERVSNT